MKSKIKKLFRSPSAWKMVNVATLLAAGVSVASAETLMMPARDARMNVPVAVWGITTQANAVTCSLDFGDGTAVQDCTGTERSYKAYTHTYGSQSKFTATLTVGAEVATVVVSVFDPASFPDGGATGDNNRNLGVNMTIEDGLRYLWTSQSNKTTFDTKPQTSWGTFPSPNTAMVVLAFQNHGYSLPSNPAIAPTGLYEKYIVQRGLNYVIASQMQLALGVTPQGDNPCVGLGAENGVTCTGLYDGRGGAFDQSYTTSLAILPLASSGALNRIVAQADVVGNLSSDYVVGKTYGEILQRQVNAVAWGQIDTNGGIGRGGWYYSFNSTSSDGSTIGWNILSMLDAGAAGAVVPTWVSTQFTNALTSHINTNGSIDYGADGDAASLNSVGPQKNGIGLQGLYWIGETTGARVDSFKTNINSWWPGASPFGIGGNGWGGPNNHGSAYAMFNNFKGMKLQGIKTLPDVNRSTHAWSFLGSTGVEDDWYADYQDWLVANQSNPTTTGGGNWAGMTFSCCYNDPTMNAATAELILSPVALVLPDALKFGSVGLLQTSNTAIEGNSHTVTAHAESTTGTPVPAATVNFSILTGPHAGLTGTGTTDSSGNADFTYADALGTTGIDTINASIGKLSSNIVSMTWTPKNAPPIALCKDVTVEAGAFCQVAAADVNDGSHDPDIGDVITLTSNPLGPYKFGSTPVTLSVSDGKVSASCTGTVTVVDTTKPGLSVPLNISIEANGVLSTVTLGDATASDSCGPLPLIATNDAPAKFKLGDTTVTWTATDAHNNISTATQIVTVVDTTKPVITAPAPVTIEATAINTPFTIAIAATATDMFGLNPINPITSNAPATYPLGNTTVTWTATDANGNKSTATQIITVVDTTKPVVTAPAAIQVEATAVKSPVAIGLATATDIFAVNPITNNAPLTYPLGTTTVIWTGTDVNGNKGTAVQTVTVVDTTKPVITYTPGNINVYDADDFRTIGTAKATDIFPVKITNDQPAAFVNHNTTVTWTAKDANGNISTSTQTVTIQVTDADIKAAADKAAADKAAAAKKAADAKAAAEKAAADAKAAAKKAADAKAAAEKAAADAKAAAKKAADAKAAADKAAADAKKAADKKAADDKAAADKAAADAKKAADKKAADDKAAADKKSNKH